MTYCERFIFELSLLAATVWAVASLAWRDLRRAVVQLAAYPPAIVAGYRRSRRYLLERRSPEFGDEKLSDDVVVRLQVALARAQLRRARAQLRRARAEGRLN